MYWLCNVNIYILGVSCIIKLAKLCECKNIYFYIQNIYVLLSGRIISATLGFCQHTVTLGTRNADISWLEVPAVAFSVSWVIKHLSTNQKVRNSSSNLRVSWESSAAFWGALEMACYKVKVKLILLTLQIFFVLNSHQFKFCK